MMEFTLSRVTVIACGLVLMLSTASCLGGMYEMRIDNENARLCDSIAYMLDSFEDSEADTLTVFGEVVLPTKDCVLTVHDHFVTLENGDRVHTSYTHWNGDMVLSHGSFVTITKSLAEGLGDLADRFREDADLLQAVV